VPCLELVIALHGLGFVGTQVQVNACRGLAPFESTIPALSDVIACKNFGTPAVVNDQVVIFNALTPGPEVFIFAIAIGCKGIGEVQLAGACFDCLDAVCIPAAFLVG